MLHSVCQQIWKTQQWPQNWKRSVFIPIPKKDNAKECSNCGTNGLISHATRLYSKFFKLGFSRTRPSTSRHRSGVQKMLRNQRSNCQHPLDHRKREFQKSICFIDYTKAFDSVDHNKLWKILKEMGIPDHLTCFLRNPYTGQEATVKTEHGKK